MGRVLQVPVAQYVRMSTEDQQYSINNQEAAIQAYATSHNYVVASTYADAGKSGVDIKSRKELRRLLADVMSGRAQFKAILVYDVSRWGRFQDVDEAAHYEFLCRSAGIPVWYCAEQFENDGSPTSSIMKVLKRTMAAEYSRELGVKVLAGQRRIALLGYRVVGSAGYGLRRMMVSPDGRRRLVLKDGERKAIQTDRTILVPGGKKEVECVRTIFDLAAQGKTPAKIAQELNLNHRLPPHGQPWGRSAVYRILKNENYAGCNTYGKTSQRLGSVSRTVDRHLWIRRPDAFVAIVTREVFDRVQSLLRKRAFLPKRTDAQLIQGMRRVLAREGKLTHRILKKRGILGWACYRRFGSIMKAYEMAGYRPASRTVKLSEVQARLRLLRKELYTRLKELFPDRIRFICLPRQKIKQVVEIDGRLRIAVYLCRPVTKGKPENCGWVLRLRPLDRHLPVLICAVDRLFSKLVSFSLLPPFHTLLKTRILRENQEWFLAGRKLANLQDFCVAANEIGAQSGNCAGNTAIDDIVIGADTGTITLGRREISLGPVTSAIFNLLVLNAGQPVSRNRIGRSLSDLSGPTCLDSHICTLRTKLGPENRKRIRTIKGIGYMYVSPSQPLDREIERFANDTAETGDRKTVQAM